MTKAIILALLCSCASKSKINVAILPQASDYKIKSQQVTDPSEAVSIIQNRRNFLISLFEQSIDPYYRTPRWSTECLKENNIGDIQQTERGYFFISLLVLNTHLTPGFCIAGGYDTTLMRNYVIHLYCSGQHEVHSLTIPHSKELEDMNWMKLCPYF